jgi:hypothetical protein
MLYLRTERELIVRNVALRGVVLTNGARLTLMSTTHPRAQLTPMSRTHPYELSFHDALALFGDCLTSKIQ